MTDEDFSVCYIHSSMDKTERDRAFQNFRTGAFRVLISSDVTARGIDIQQVSTVINFDITKCPHKYLHRIGRSGRWGRKGMAINFITKQDVDIMRKIERHYDIEIKELPASFNGAVC
jgi:superfamily II DNA/RNA helicase